MKMHSMMLYLGRVLMLRHKLMRGLDANSVQGLTVITTRENAELNKLFIIVLYIYYRVCITPDSDSCQHPAIV